MFEEELKLPVQILAGDNCELEGDDGQLSEQIVQLRLNTVPDFMMCRLAPPTAELSTPSIFTFFSSAFPLYRSYLDMMKVIIFSYMFWFVLTIIFITGTTR